MNITNNNNATMQQDQLAFQMRHHMEMEVECRNKINTLDRNTEGAEVTRLLSEMNQHKAISDDCYARLTR